MPSIDAPSIRSSSSPKIVSTVRARLGQSFVQGRTMPLRSTTGSDQIAGNAVLSKGVRIENPETGLLLFLEIEDELVVVFGRRSDLHAQAGLFNRRHRVMRASRTRDRTRDRNGRRGLTCDDDDDFGAGFELCASLNEKAARRNVCDKTTLRSGVGAELARQSPCVPAVLSLFGCFSLHRSNIGR